MFEKIKYYVTWPSLSNIMQSYNPAMEQMGLARDKTALKEMFGFEPKIKYCSTDPTRPCQCGEKKNDRHNKK